jgi:hypothetical protein
LQEIHIQSSYIDSVFLFKRFSDLGFCALMSWRFHYIEFDYLRRSNLFFYRFWWFRFLQKILQHTGFQTTICNFRELILQLHIFGCNNFQLWSVLLFDFQNLLLNHCNWMKYWHLLCIMDWYRPERVNLWVIVEFSAARSIAHSIGLNACWGYQRNVLMAEKSSIYLWWCNLHCLSIFYEFLEVPKDFTIFLSVICKQQ